MGERFDPAAWLDKVFPKGIEKSGLLDGNLDIKKRYLKALVRATGQSGRKITAEVYKTVEFYAEKEAALKAAGERAFKQEALNGQVLLTSRLKNFLVYTEVQEQRKRHKGKMYRWLPSSAETPDPEHQLLYGKIFREGTGDKDGYMPGERWGCQCGIEWLDDNEAFKEFAGKEYSGHKGQKAVRKLLKEQQGYVLNAFKRKDLGGISLVWGDKEKGLEHIICRRASQKIDVQAFLKDLSTVVQKGKVYPDRTFPKERLNVWHRKKQKLVVISKFYGKTKKPWVLTAFKQKKAPKR